MNHYHVALTVWVAIAIVVFFVLLKIDAPFGRHTKRGWGPVISNRVAWIIMEATVLVSFWSTWFFSGGKFTRFLCVAMGLFSAHYIHRALIYPMFLRTRGKVMPVVIMLSAVAFNSVNGFFLGYHFSHFANQQSAWLTNPIFLFGMLLFFLGMLVNVITDYQLIRMRKRTETGYKIPQGILFRWVSAPNLLGEIVEWAGYALLTFSLPALAFFVWTLANLVPRALAHHKWYRATFQDYPAVRGALWPNFL